MFDETDSEEETLEADHPAVAEDGITFAWKKANPKAKLIKSFWNLDHTVCWSNLVLCSYIFFKTFYYLINKQLIEAELLEGKNNKTNETKMCQTFKDVSLYKK